MNRKGQEFAAFRLLIDATLVIMVLVIILGIVTWVQEWQFGISEEKIYSGFDKAINSPNGKTILEKSVMLRENRIYLATEFARAGLSRECIKFDALGLSSLQLSNSDRQLDVKENVMLDIFFQCYRSFAEEAECDESKCDICCTISFGKDFEET